MQRFDDRRIVITGAGSGIGQATVARLLEEGGTVVAIDVAAEGLARTTAAAEDAGTAKRLTTAVLDISDEVAVGSEVAAAVNTLDGLDVLVNAAAIQLCAHTHEHTLHDWNTTLAINLTGTFLMTRASLPALIDSGRGVVVNFTSTAATFAHPYMAAYAASKGGVLAFTHALALEYSKQGFERSTSSRVGCRRRWPTAPSTRCPRDTTWHCGPSRLRCCTARRTKSSATPAPSRP